MKKSIKTCDWYYGKSDIPDLTKCKKCSHNLGCLGRDPLSGEQTEWERQYESWLENDRQGNIEDY